MTSTHPPAEEGGMPTRTDVVDVCQPGANMWGCVNCPKCGSECRNATDEYFGDPAASIVCADCGFVEPIARAVGSVGNTELYDVADLVARAGIQPICLVCDAPITSGNSIRAHAACVACPSCGEEMSLNKMLDEPAELTCYACIQRADCEAQQRVADREQREYADAEELLLSGGGDRDARAAAIQVIADYHFSQGCS